MRIKRASRQPYLRRASPHAAAGAFGAESEKKNHLRGRRKISTFFTRFSAHTANCGGKLADRSKKKSGRPTDRRSLFSGAWQLWVRCCGERKMFTSRTSSSLASNEEVKKPPQATNSERTKEREREEHPHCPHSHLSDCARAAGCPLKK